MNSPNGAEFLSKKESGGLQRGARNYDFYSPESSARHNHAVMRSNAVLS
jgi:hypothetical protein